MLCWEDFTENMIKMHVLRKTPVVPNALALCIRMYMCIYIYIHVPATQTIADPETHPLRGFVPFWPAVFSLLDLFF